MPLVAVPASPARRAVVPTVLVVLLAATNLAPSMSFAATPTTRYKAALLPLVAGRHDANCMAIGGPTGIGPGAPIVIDGAGRITAGPRSDDVVNGPAEIMLQLEHSTSMVNFSAAALGPDGQPANGYNVASGKAAPEVVTMASGGKSDVVDQCRGGPTPRATGVDLWRLAASLVKVHEAKAMCTGNDKPLHAAAVVFSDALVRIDDYALTPAAPHDVEIVIATDKNEGSFNYSVTDKAGNIAMITVEPDGRVSGGTLQRADGTSIGCGTQ